jgi:voltage-gated potassium channel
MKSLQKDDIPHILIEINEKKVELIQESNKTFILLGDATNEKKLIEAGVERAKGLVTCLADDAKNVYVVLTARDLNRNLHIVSRAIEEQAEPKLIRAGANRVISPIIIGSQSMLRALTKPAIADFMESIVAENLDLVFDEIPISSRSEYANIALRNTNISSELKILVVAIRRGDGEMLFNPSASTKIIDKDLLIVIGKAESVKKLVEANQ